MASGGRGQDQREEVSGRPSRQGLDLLEDLWPDDESDGWRKQLEERERQERQLKEIPELKEALEALHEKVSAVEKEKEEMTSKMKDLEDKYKETSTRNSTLEKEIRTQQAAHEQTLNDTRQRLSAKVQALERETRSLRTEKEGSEDQAAQLRQSLDQLRSHADQLERSKAQAENSGRELQRQLQTSHTELAALEQKLKLSAAESEQLKRENQELQRERAALEQKLELSAAESEQLKRENQELQRKPAALEELVKEVTAERERLQAQSQDLEEKKAALEREFARMMASKEKERSEVARRARAAEKSLAAMERRLKAEEAKTQAKLESERKETAKLQSRLENEMRLSEEFRRLLGTRPDQDFHQQVAAALQRVERGLHQVAEDLSHRHKRSDPDAPFMDRLPPDVRSLSIHLQRHIGGHGQLFSQLLLGSSFSLSEEDLQEGGLFFSSRKFWLCIKKWVEASSRDAVPLTSEQLRQACRGLLVDPTTLTPITPAHEQALEKNFAYLEENLRVVEVMPYLRSSPLMTADAWSFLLDGRGPGQKVDRLLAVVYSMGEEGYKDLIAALRDSWNQHVLGVFPQDEAKEEVLKRAGLPSQDKMAEPDTPKEDKDSAAAAPPQVTDADTRRASDDEEDDEDGDEPVMSSLAKALAEMESRVVARVREVEARVDEGVKGVVAEVKSVSAGVLAGIEQVREATRSLEKEIDVAKQETKAGSEALGGIVEKSLQGVALEAKKTQQDVLTEIDQVKVIARAVAEEVNNAKQETKASSEALGGKVERGFQGVTMEVTRARDGVLAGIQQVREANRSVEKGVDGVKQEVAKSSSEATEIKKRISALEQEIKRSKQGLFDKWFRKSSTESEQASGGKESGEGGGEV